MTKRCPACGAGHQFSRWLNMDDDCKRCGLHFERIEGHWIGAIGINTIVSFGTLLASMVVGFILSFPDFNVGLLTLISVAVAVIVPVAGMPFSKTFWTAIDIAMRPLEAHEVSWTVVDPAAFDSGGEGSDEGRLPPERTEPHLNPE